MTYLLPGVFCFIVWLVCNMHSIRQGKNLPARIKDDSVLRDLWAYSRSYLLVLGGPAGEELVFRLPLLLLFSNMSPTAISFVIGTALFFAVVHNGPGELNRTVWHVKNWRKIVERTYLQFILGITTGIVALWTQSLLLAVATHMLWNLYWWIMLQRYIAKQSLSFEEKLLFSEWYGWKLRLLMLRLRWK